MPDDACPLPYIRDDNEGNTPEARAEADAIRRMLAGKRIAVVGLSHNPSRASHSVASYLRSVGKEIVPVNPRYEAVMGLKCYATLQDVPGSIDVVDVFRRAEYCPDIARAAVAVGAKGLWLQSGITSDEARAIARKAGIDYVEDRCLKVDHMFSR